jgi:uncharacterized protein
MKPVIIYHANCMDGFGAALAAWVRFGNTAEYVAARYGDDPPNIVDRDVFILDFSYPLETMCTIQMQSTKLVVIDHHKSALPVLNALRLRPFAGDEIVFGIDQSGAVLSWGYFHQSPVPLLFQYIQDRDLWHWDLDLSREVSAALAIQHRSFENFENILRSRRLAIVELARQGAIICQADREYVKAILDSPPVLENIGGYSVPCINNNHLISEVGNALAENYPFSAQWFETATHRIYSLRSVDTGVDVAVVAEQYGGGGHARAAGFSILRQKVEL